MRIQIVRHIRTFPIADSLPISGFRITTYAPARLSRGRHRVSAPARSRLMAPARDQAQVTTNRAHSVRKKSQGLS